MKLSIAWIFDHLNTSGASWKDYSVPDLAQKLTMTTAEIERVTPIDQDYILEIDNVALTHRPDLWCHRGFAREIAAILKVPVTPLDQFLSKVPASRKQTISVEVLDKQLCPHYAGLYIEHIENGVTPTHIAARLRAIDVKSHNAIVDFTNYVMFDIGQPLHAFDAKNIKKIVVRKGQEGDLVITDGHEPIALAGVKGYPNANINPGTDAIFLESATFDGAAIRRAVTRTKLRTDASARFEKGVSPYSNTLGIERFLKLMHESKLAMRVADDMVVVGTLPEQPTIELSHELLEARVGKKIKSQDVVSALEGLEFTVRFPLLADAPSGRTETYHVLVPTHRLKDVTIPEDLIEEVVRSIGYSTIVPYAPAVTMQPHDIRKVMTLRKIKQHLSSACAMHEVATYSLTNLPVVPENELRNPVSEQYTGLVTSLIPNLLKAVEQHAHTHDRVRFFECARVWDPTERRVVSGVFHDRKNKIDYYERKAYIEQLGEIKGAYGLHDEHTFTFELDLDHLLSHVPEHKKYKPVSKYPAVWLDVSLFAPYTVTVAALEHAIKAVDARIESVSLVDMFEKKEWTDRRSLTFRYVVQDHAKTLEKADISAIEQAVTRAVTNLGAQPR